MSRPLKFGLSLAAFVALAGCTPDYSPDVYNANAVQQANKVEPAVVVGFREVSISASGTVGAVTGGAAGGILGAQVGPNGTTEALGAVGGGVVGSLIGTGIEHATSDTTGWEYIVQKPNGDLLSVTQREPKPIPLGQKVLVITGAQARIIPDYSVAKEPPKDKDKPAKPAAADAAPVPPATAPAAVVPPWSVVPMAPQAPTLENVVPQNAAPPSTAAAPPVTVAPVTVPTVTAPSVSATPLSAPLALLPAVTAPAGSAPAPAEPEPAQPAAEPPAAAPAASSPALSPAQ